MHGSKLAAVSRSSCAADALVAVARNRARVRADQASPPADAATSAVTPDELVRRGARRGARTRGKTTPRSREPQYHGARWSFDNRGAAAAPPPPAARALRVRLAPGQPASSGIFVMVHPRWRTSSTSDGGHAEGTPPPPVGGQRVPGALAHDLEVGDVVGAGRARAERAPDSGPYAPWADVAAASVMPAATRAPGVERLEGVAVPDHAARRVLDAQRGLRQRARRRRRRRLRSGLARQSRAGGTPPRRRRPARRCTARRRRRRSPSATPATPPPPGRARRRRRCRAPLHRSHHPPRRRTAPGGGGPPRAAPRRPRLARCTSQM